MSGKAAHINDGREAVGPVMAIAREAADAQASRIIGTTEYSISRKARTISKATRP